MFEGFAKDAMGFWFELQTEMNKPWFEANKPRYQALWVEPVTALLEHVRGKLATAYRGERLAPPKILRIYRDVRFAKDKTPYKTWIGASVAVTGDKQRPMDSVVAIYAHFGLDGPGTADEFVGSGQYFFADRELVRWRKAVHAPKSGAAIAKLVAAAQANGYSLVAAETLARVPKPYAADHPRAELLKLKGLTLGFPAIPRGLIHKPAFADWCVEHARATAPVGRWLRANVSV